MVLGLLAEEDFTELCMTEIVLNVSRHQSHCVFSVEFVVFQCRVGENMPDALIVAFYFYYNSGTVR